MVTVCVSSKLKTSWKLVVFSNKAWKNSLYFVGVFNIKTVFPLTLAGYVMIIANSYPTRTRGIVNYNDHGTDQFIVISGLQEYCTYFDGNFGTYL